MAKYMSIREQIEKNILGKRIPSKSTLEITKKIKGEIKNNEKRTKKDDGNHEAFRNRV